MSYYGKTYEYVDGYFHGDANEMSSSELEEFIETQ